jgi:hypothetical protein
VFGESGVSPVVIETPPRSGPRSGSRGAGASSRREARLGPHAGPIDGAPTAASGASIARQSLRLFGEPSIVVLNLLPYSVGNGRWMLG